MLLKKSVGSYQTVSHEKIPEEISVSANRWPSFSLFGFAYGGYLVTENENYSIKGVFNPMGRIRLTAVERK